MPTTESIHEYLVHGARMPSASHAAIRKVKQQHASPEIHGDRLWDSSLLLIDYLHQHLPEHHSTVLDAGCGWGISGIWCAKTLGSQVASVDADKNVFPYLEAVAELNQTSTLALSTRFERLSVRQLAEFDMLIAADICFWDELVNPVCKMIDRAVTAGVKHIVIADPERSSFFKVAQRCMDKHYAELIEWKVNSPLSAQGAILVIENA